ncbi:hypothetical protein LPH50_09710 [Xylella taiwanensis]|uniref:Uncharacterized protein n=1 Tax=Xylella taiwanensis TaxID=1444770 RepID=A0ABS8TTT9_9GAMM|nr:hypothetical protein [Xylella taiwanensis]MCD8456212.1 hypothetical protein [Xylella taiwanensis]MCD8460755.1 hypothetical protein [Xylella taiwanensis]MCD8463186.1 hypothetical protein [Xylella taiwanensis]MCD8465261.1 hypothetical protein [Xylella taiwanensis]MCD8467182.1 hypothetical protein [Xylella taiwanensis]
MVCTSHLAGHSVVIVGSRFVTTVTRGIDRERVVVVFAALLARSNLSVA